MSQGEQEGFLLQNAVVPAFLCHQADVPVPLVFLQGAEQLVGRLHGAEARLVKQQLETEPECEEKHRFKITAILHPRYCYKPQRRPARLFT